MFALLQIYPLEANADDGSDDNCCLDVIAIDTTEARLKRFLADYEPTYREAVAAFDAWYDNAPRDWGEKHDRTDEGVLVRETRFKIVEVAVDRRPVSG
jgi:hypothetical protein